jgi:GNAT superfamily N-acetyltransferase
MARRATGGRVSGDDVPLRAGTARDRAFVLDLGRRTASDSVSALRAAPPAFVEASYERLAEYALERSHVLLIAESALEGPVGFILMVDDVPDEVTALEQGFVAYMAVEPDARRRGVAALMVTEENAAARELYAQAGYATERRLLCKPL